MHPVFILAFVTLAAVIAFLVWNLQSTRRHQQSGGGNIGGIGGVNDPMSGTTPNMRDPEEMRQSMDAAEVSRGEPRRAGQMR